MMRPLLTLAIPIALLWMAVTGTVSPGGFLVGYLLGLALLIVLGRLGLRPKHGIGLRQLGSTLVYVGHLLADVVLSSLQVARIILAPRPRLQTGILAVPSGDRRDDQLLTALSAHGINISPGQLVIDIDEMGTLYIHCLDLAASRPTIEQQQRERLRLLRAVIGAPADD
jgi:multisubunit Na+/H+ antiporter MnhE subunit